MLYIDGNSANPNISYIENMIVCGIGPEPLADIFAGLGKTNTAVTAQIDKSFKPGFFPDREGNDHKGKYNKAS